MSSQSGDLTKGGALEVAEENQENISNNIIQENSVPEKPQSQEVSGQENTDMVQ